MKQNLIILVLALGLSSLITLQADDNNPLISISSPAYCSDISGNTPIDIVAPGLTSVTVKCWSREGGKFGSDATVGTVSLDAAGKGTINFPADQFPHGPITVKISGKTGSKFDDCYLQLYNKSGASWNEGIPMEDPPGASGMHQVFSDDFKGPLSISSTDPKARYYDHKPPNGSQDFSTIPFTGYDSPNNPFSQVDTYLRIRADAKKNSSGLISSLKNDATGFKVGLPCYFECRFIGPNAKGTWPAFWLLTDYMTDLKAGKSDKTEPVDELDIIEAVGGEGQGEPNATGERKLGFLYQITPHAWNQGDAGNALANQAYKDMKDPVDMQKAGIPSTWFEAMHTYGCKITETETIYYCDNIEMGRHKTLPTSKKYPFFFLINLATGGGWKVDLSRYNGLADMYVDFVRVYAQDK